ncbi:hypothetical protein [Wolbachia endosymbiont of Cylisticus convexus]|uniref:hypothetical protein n=1 Tax=Wolbachia endosymbiont of Cylisticus convexus TaxID=118728 RepID=UPI001F22ABB2|nr:hypothetical protein [Wolbachia endosymbiont of Cylisticus convexus]
MYIRFSLFKKLLGTILVPYSENRVKSPHMHTVKEPSFGDAVSKLSKEKKQEEYLVLLKGKSNSSVTTLTEGSSSTQSASKSASGKNERGYIK